MEERIIVLTTRNGSAQFVDDDARSVYLDIGVNGKNPDHKFRILPDGTVFKIVLENGEEVELKEGSNK